MKQLRKMTVFAFSLFVCWAARQAQAQTRTDEIEAARTAKEANLTPEAQPKAEQDIEWAENSLAYRLFTGQLDGFGLGFGTIVPGSSVAFGPRYVKRFWDGKLFVRLDARASVNESYLGRMEVGLPHLFHDHAFVTFVTQHRDISEMPYYGPGPDSRKTGRSDYRLEDTNVELHPGVRIYKGLSASLIGSYLADHVGPGHSTRYISTGEQYSPDAAPGIDHQTDFWRGGGDVVFDWRDDPAKPTSGGRYSAQYVRYLDQDLAHYSFLRLDLSATQYIPLFNHTRVIAIHAASSLTTTSSGQEVPFYLQPILGGPDTLPGYRYGRFYGNNSTLIQGEYRWFCSPILDVSGFVGGGKVFNNWNEWNFHGLQSDAGFALHFKGRTGADVFNFATGFSHEGFQLWFHINNLI